MRLSPNQSMQRVLGVMSQHAVCALVVGHHYQGCLYKEPTTTRSTRPIEHHHHHHHYHHLPVTRFFDTTMSNVSSTTTSSSNFQNIFNTALEAYKKKTKNDLLTHPLSAKLQHCHSPTAILLVLQELVQQLNQHRCRNKRIRSCLNPIVNVLYAFSTTIGEGVGYMLSCDSHTRQGLIMTCQGFPPAKAIFAGIGVLLLVG